MSSRKDKKVFRLSAHPWKYLGMYFALSLLVREEKNMDVVRRVR